MKPRFQLTKEGLGKVRIGRQAQVPFGVVERRKWTYIGELRALVSLLPGCLTVTNVLEVAMLSLVISCATFVRGFNEVLSLSL